MRVIASFNACLKDIGRTKILGIFRSSSQTKCRNLNLTVLMSLVPQREVDEVGKSAKAADQADARVSGTDDKLRRMS